MSAIDPPFKNEEKLFSSPVVRDIGDQIEYLPPTESGNETMHSFAKPIERAFFEFAVMTMELFEFLFWPNHFKHNKVSSVSNDLDEKI